MSDLVLNRIRILKTGLARVDEYVDMSDPENIEYFENLAVPGTELILRRVTGNNEDLFRIQVLGPDHRFLGRVTLGKNETPARLMDAGVKLIAIVNESLPIHDSDFSDGLSDVVDPKDPGWNENSRIAEYYRECNLPYSIYMIDEAYDGTDN